MATRLGYLLPTREKIMAGEPAATPLLDLAARAERLGFDAIWIGDSLFARPRHAPLTLWTGKRVDGDGRWKVEGAVLGPTPHRPGGPPLWVGGSLPASIDRAGRYFDGWMPITPHAAQWGRQWREIKDIARANGRNADAL